MSLKTGSHSADSPIRLVLSHMYCVLVYHKGQQRNEGEIAMTLQQEVTPITVQNANLSHHVIRLALIENDPFAMNAIIRILNQQFPSLAVNLTFAAGLDAITYFETHGNVADVIMMDMHLSDIEGPRVAWQIRRMNDYTPILAVTSLPLKRYRSPIAKTGAQGLLPKKDLTGIATAITRLCAGYVYEGFDAPAVAARRIQREFSPLLALTPAQTHVIELLADGLDNEAIADCLHCAAATVRKHRQSILRRLDARTTIEAVNQWQHWNHMLGID